MWQNRCRHKSVQKYRHILFLTLLAAISIAVILLYNQLCWYQFNFLTDIFFADNFHLRTAARTFSFSIGNGAGDNFCFDVSDHLVTLGLRIFSNISLNSFLYRFFGLFITFQFGFIEK